MNRSFIKEEDLVFTDKGTRVLYQPGTVIDKLTVLAYKGKRWIKSRDTFEAVYEVQCVCGNIDLRRHTYLANDTTVNGKSCFDCAIKNSSRNLVRIGQYKPRKKKEEEVVLKDDEYYMNIIKEIFDMPINEVMEKYQCI